MSDHPESFEKAKALAEKVGFRFYVGSWPNYDPERGQGADNTEDLCHEIAHYLTTPKRIRNKPHFGLGHPAGSRPASQWLTEERCGRLEHEASLLGIVLATECGLPFDRVATIAIEHDWHRDLVETPAQVEARLRRKGLWPQRRERMLRRVFRALDITL